MQAAFLLADLGLDPYKVDKAIAAGFGMPMGPFRFGVELLRCMGLGCCWWWSCGALGAS